MNDNDLYIKLLKWADSRETFTLKKIKKELYLTEQQTEILLKQIHNRQLFVTSNPRGVTVGDTLWMSVEDKFRLLEYDELKEAREASKNATYFATAALVISILTLIASIVQMYLAS